MEATKGDMPEEQAPESLPTEIQEEKPKKTKLLAVIIVVVLIVAAIAAAIGLGLFGGEEEPTNVAPTGGARASSATNILIGQSVSFESLATDSDGDVVDFAWYFGDGEMVNGSDLRNVTHTYDYGGSYWVYHVVTDDGGATASNEASMIRVNVAYYDVPEDAAEWTNETAPYAFLTSDEDIIENNTLVSFSMSGYAVAWYNDTTGFVASWENLSAATLDYGDGSAEVDITLAEVMDSEHSYVGAGHYAAAFTVEDGALLTTVMRTIHVLTEQAPTPGVIKNPDAFVMVTFGEPQYLDPAVDYETAGGEVIQQVYEQLIFYDRDSVVDLVPVLATEVPTVANGGISEDGLYYNFTIKTDVKFHDNTTMDIDDVNYSFQRVMTIHDPNGPSWMLEQVLTDYLSYSVGDELQNFSSYADWVMETIDPTLDPHHVITEADVLRVQAQAVQVVDSDTISFHLTHAYPGFIQIAAYTVMAVVSDEFVEDHGGVVYGEQNDYVNQHMCGTGPYQLVTWEIGSKIHMTRFDDYHGVAPALKDVYIRKANDVNTRLLMLQAGDADCIAMPMEYESMFSGDTDFRIVKGLPTFSIMFAGFNFNINTTAAATFGSDVPSDFFSDKHVRLAFASLINYSMFIENVLFDNAILPNGVIPKGMFGYSEDVPTYEYDLANAEAEFKLAINPDTGNSWWDDGFSIAFMYNAGNTYRETACLYMKESLESLGAPGGFTAQIYAFDWPNYLANLRLKPSPFPMFWLGWAPDYADPDDYTTPFLDSVYGNYPHTTGYSNASIDALVREAAAEIDNERRAMLYYNMSMLVYEDVPYIWLYQANNFHIERSWVRGYFFNPMFGGLAYYTFSKA